MTGQPGADPACSRWDMPRPRDIESACRTARNGSHARPTVDEFVGVVGQHLANEVERTDDAPRGTKAPNMDGIERGGPGSGAPTTTL